jgi:hypothetical protein
MGALSTLTKLPSATPLCPSPLRGGHGKSIFCLSPAAHQRASYLWPACTDVRELVIRQHLNCFSGIAMYDRRIFPGKPLDVARGHRACPSAVVRAISGPSWHGRASTLPRAIFSSRHSQGALLGLSFIGCCDQSTVTADPCAADRRSKPGPGWPLRRHQLPQVAVAQGPFTSCLAGARPASPRRLVCTPRALP